MLQLINRFTLGIAAREGWDLSPETAIRVFMDDNGVIPHVPILSQAASAVATPKFHPKALTWSCRNVGQVADLGPAEPRSGPRTRYARDILEF